jgi:hypothetical protein
MTTPKTDRHTAHSVAIGRSTSRALREGHPFAVVLYAHGWTVAAWCRHASKRYREPLTRSSASGWVHDGEGGRKVPWIWAKRIESEFPELPATSASWRNGITGGPDAASAPNGKRAKKRR